MSPTIAPERPLRSAPERYGIDLVEPPVEPTPRRRPPPVPTDRLLELDGLRGVALLLVVAFHEGWLEGGFLGLELFFVVSGYLITRNLLPRSGGRRQSLATFWARRVRRLLPAMLLLLVAAQVWVRFAPPGHVRLLNGQVQSALAYVGNWYAIAADSGYWEAGATKTALLHLWSLAVEEQFYLLWPLVLGLGFKLSRGRVTRWMIGGTVVLAVASMTLVPVVYAIAGADRAYYGTDTRVGTILLGAALALVPARKLGGAPAAALRLAVWPASFWLGAALVLLSTHSPLLYQGGFALTGLSCLVLVAALTHLDDRRLRRILTRPLIVWIGVRSYGLYLWAWPVQVILTHGRTGWSGPQLLLLKAVTVLVLAELSHRLVEAPARSGRFAMRRLLVVLAVVAAGVFLASVRWQPAPPVTMTAGAVLHEAPAAGGSLRLMVVGDSWARSVGSGLVSAGDDQHAVLNDGMASCGLLARATLTEGAVREAEPDCRAWPTRWAEEVAAFRPTAVVLTTGQWDLSAVQIGGRFVRPDHPSFTPVYEDAIDRAIRLLGSGGAPVYVTTVIDGIGADERRWTDRMNMLLAAAVKRHDHARLLDLHRLLCRGGCPDRLDGAEVYDDTRHLTPEWERRVGAWMLARFERELDGLTPEQAAAARRDHATRFLPSSSEYFAAPTGIVSEHPEQEAVALELLGVGAERTRRMTVGAARIDRFGDEEARSLYLRFADDATPDLLARQALRRMHADGWERFDLSSGNVVLLHRGNRVRVIVRAPYEVASLELRTRGDIATAAQRVVGAASRWSGSQRVSQ